VRSIGDTAQRVDIRSRADLDAAVALGDRPKVLRIHGRIDLAQGRGARDFADPAFDFDAYCRAYSPEAWGRRALSGPLEEARKRSVARRRRRGGKGSATARDHRRDARRGVRRRRPGVTGTHDVVLQDLHFHGVRDHFPAWDPLDGSKGEWNSDYDAVSIVRGRRVWSTTARSGAPIRPWQRIFDRTFETNDGLLDITRAADLVTVSWCRFSRHDKTMLIGGSDRHADDEPHLRVTLHHNLWEDCAERTPRVRFGRVHVVNNLFVVTPGAHYGYSIGLGLKARIVSEDNAWETGPKSRRRDWFDLGAERSSRTGARSTTALRWRSPRR
jgi:hypothetical protein